MRIGLDADGVCVDFNAAYVDGLRAWTGRDLFHPNDRYHPPVWDYPEHRGYTAKEVSSFWRTVHAAPEFWTRLKPLPDFLTALPRLQAALRAGHSLAIVTNRQGPTATSQTADWFAQYLSEFLVVSTADKAAALVDFQVETFLDDKWENAVDIEAVLPTTSFLLNRQYNQGPVGAPPVRRVSSLHSYLDALSL